MTEKLRMQRRGRVLRSVKVLESKDTAPKTDPTSEKQRSSVEKEAKNTDSTEQEITKSEKQIKEEVADESGYLI